MGTVKTSEKTVTCVFGQKERKFIFSTSRSNEYPNLPPKDIAQIGVESIEIVKDISQSRTYPPVAMLVTAVERGGLAESIDNIDCGGIAFCTSVYFCYGANWEASYKELLTRFPADATSYYGGQTGKLLLVADNTIEELKNPEATITYKNREIA